MLNALVVGDPHLTMNPQDEYRWKLFDSFIPYLIKKKGVKPNYLIILGDLTDKKDRHDAHIVTRLCRVMTNLAALLEVHIIKGNHDYADPEFPFFAFLNMFRSNIYFYSDPYYWNDEKTLLLPHSLDPKKDWRMTKLSRQHSDYIFMHQTVFGSITSSGYKMKEGIKKKFFDNFPESEIISGDIHKPQQCGNVRYIGTPYPINFDDHHENKILHIHDGEIDEIDTTHLMRRRTIRIKFIRELKDIELKRGTQVKVSMELPPYDMSSWRWYKEEIGKICDKKGWKVYGREVIPQQGITKKRRNQKASAVGNDPEVQFRHYCEGEGIKGSDVYASGVEIIKEFQNEA